MVSVYNSKLTGYITTNDYIALYAFNTEYTACFYKHLKLRNQARLYLAISYFKVQIMLKLSQ